MGQAHHPFAWVAFNFAKRVKLLEKDVLEAGFLVEFPARRIVERFIHTNEATGQGPGSLEGFERPLDQQDFEFILIKTEDHAVHSQSGTGILVSVWHEFQFVDGSLAVAAHFKP